MKLAAILGVAAGATGSATAAGPMFHLRGADIVGKDLNNVAIGDPIDCLTYCMSQPRCSSISWTPYNGGTCWLKNTQFKGTPTTPNVEVESYLVLPEATSKFIWSETKEGFDMAGYDLTNTRRANIGQCMADCNGYTECFAVSWTNYNGGTCWLKTRASGYVAKAGAKVAYVARAGL